MITGRARLAPAKGARCTLTHGVLLPRVRDAVRPVVPEYRLGDKLTIAMDAAVNLGDLGGYEKLDVYLKEDGALEQRGIDDERTEADGVGEIIFGVGIQVSAPQLTSKQATRMFPEKSYSRRARRHSHTAIAGSSRG